MSEHDADLPSLGQVQTEVDRLVAEQERRADAYDTLSSLLVGFCAALIGLSGNDGLLVVCAKVASTASAGAAMAALVVRATRRARPRALRDRYLRASPSTTAIVLLDSKIWLYEQDERQLEHKLARIRVALGSLAVGVLLFLTSSYEAAMR